MKYSNDKMKRWFVLGFLISATGCGSRDSPQETPISREHSTLSLAVDTLADLPSCETENDGQLAYAVAEAQFYACKSGEWLAIEIPNIEPSQVTIATEPAGANCATGGVVLAKGDAKFYACNGSKGTDGLSGANGVDGLNGKDGVDYETKNTGKVQIDSIYICGGSSDDLVPSNSDLHATYVKATKFKNDTYMIEAFFSTYSFRSEQCLSFGLYCEAIWSKAAFSNPATFVRALFDPSTATVSYENHGINGGAEVESGIACQKID